MRKSKSLSNLMQQQQQQKQQKQKRAFAKGETVIQNEENSMKLDKDEKALTDGSIKYDTKKKKKKKKKKRNSKPRRRRMMMISRRKAERNR